MCFSRIQPVLFMEGVLRSLVGDKYPHCLIEKDPHHKSRAYGDPTMGFPKIPCLPVPPRNCCSAPNLSHVG